MGVSKYPKYLRMGMKFGRLIIIGVDPDSMYTEGGVRNSAGKLKYICECTCKDKSIKSVPKNALVRLATTSCGCVRKEKLKIIGESLHKINPIEDCGNYIKIFFFNVEHGYFVVDKEDYTKVKDYCWCLEPTESSGLSYAMARIPNKYRSNYKTRNIKAHQIILPTEEGFIAEHKDGDGLNNRRNNLRPATHSQNMMNTKLPSTNTSGHKGVSFISTTNKWLAKIEISHRCINLGRYDNKEDAIKARREAEGKYYMEFSSKNRGGISEGRIKSH